MLRFPRFQFSIAQMLVLMFLVAVVCGWGVMFRRLWIYRLPGVVRDIQMLPDGSAIALALSEEGRCCVVLCDCRSGECLHYADLAGGAPDNVRISSDCGTWAAVFADGNLEFGRVASGERWRGRVDLEPRAPPTHPWQDREAGVALNRTGAVAAVWRGSRIAILDGRDGRELRVVHAPIGVERMSLSDDGTRLAAGLEDRGERRSGIGVWDTASGRLAAIVPPREAAWRPQIVWIGDDVIACAPRLPGGDPEVCFTVISRLETRRFHYAILVSPIVANSGGTVVAVANGFEFVLVLNTGDMGELSSDLATDFCPSVIVAMAISDDGATVATRSRDDYSNEPRRLFIDDRRSHALREIRPWRSRRGCWAALAGSGVSLVAFSIWLLWRARPGEELKNSGDTILISIRWQGLRKW